jgi:hypothetical protein
MYVSFLIASPDPVQGAAQDVAGIGSSLARIVTSMTSAGS